MKHKWGIHLSAVDLELGSHVPESASACFVISAPGRWSPQPRFHGSVIRV